MGAGSGITRRAHPVRFKTHVSEWSALYSDELSVALSAAGDGCVVTLASKIVSELENEVIFDPDLDRQISTVSFEELVEYFQGRHPDRFSVQQISLLDQGRQNSQFVFGPANPNRTCSTVAAQIKSRFGVLCDVVLADSGSGAAKGSVEIGVTTYISTPIGATAGLGLAHAQRCAAAAEVIGNQIDMCPIVVLEPESPRSGLRSQIGSFRYDGYINAERERCDLPFMRGFHNAT